MSLEVGPISPVRMKQIIQEVLGQGADISPANPLLVNFPPGVAALADVTDRWARQLGQVDLARVRGAALAAANPVIAGIYDAAGNRMPAMDAVARPGFVDPIDRAARLLGIIYGSQGQQLQQKAATFELITEDTGLHTNPELWLQSNHWDSDEVAVVAAGVGGQQNLGAAVAALKVRRIREITIRHAGSANTVVTLLVSGGTTKATIDVPAQTTRVWSSQDGRAFTAAQQPAVQTSDVTGGSTYVSASGVEA